MYTLYGHTFSPNTARVVFCFLEMGLQVDKDFTLRPIEFDEMQSEEWAAKHHPFQLMPYLVDDEAGLEVYESRAIVKYVARKLDSPLHVTHDEAEIALYESGQSYELCAFDTFAEGLAWELKWKEMYIHEKTNESMAKDLSKVLRRKMEGFERLLARQGYVGGKELTLVDLFFVPQGFVLLDIGEGQELVDGSKPNIARWWKEISERETWKETQRVLGEIPCQTEF